MKYDYTYGLTKEVVVSYVYNNFNNGMGIYSSHYDYLIDFIINECDLVTDDNDLFCNGIDFSFDIEYDFSRYYIEHHYFEEWVGFVCNYYIDMGYSPSEIISEYFIDMGYESIFLKYYQKIFKLFDDEGYPFDEDEIKELLSEAKGDE